VAVSKARATDGLAVARRFLVVVLAAEVAVLVVTGIWLVFNYQPSGAVGVSFSGVRYPAAHVGWIRMTHRFVSTLALVTSVATGAAIVADAFIRAGGRRKQALLVIGPTLMIAVGAAGLTGYLLPWDQLSLRAVSVGSFKGYRAVFGSNVRFVLTGHSEISQATLWRWFVIHAVVLSVAIFVLLLAAVILVRRSRAPISDPADAPQTATPRPIER
jgi:cytochrome b6